MDKMTEDGVWQEITMGYSKALCMQQHERAEQNFTIKLMG
jgi:hypothetical protein